MVAPAADNYWCKGGPRYLYLGKENESGVYDTYWGRRRRLERGLVARYLDLDSYERCECG